jgi:hypothetical protein
VRKCVGDASTNLRHSWEVAEASPLSIASMQVWEGHRGALCKRKSQFAQMITFSLPLLIAACFTLVSPQLALAQHTALMELYNALGLSTVTEKESKEQKIIFLFRLFHCIVPTLCGD